jgi:hypothetical protein
MTNDPFNFWYDKKAYDLHGLSMCLADMSDEEFVSYVNGTKNDFANWIENALENSQLADKIRPIIEKDIILATLNEELNGEQTKLSIGSTSVHSDSLVQEVMKKNDEFFKTAENKAETIHDEQTSEIAPEISKAETEINKTDTEMNKAETQISKAEDSPKVEAKSKLSLIDFPGLRKKEKEKEKEKSSKTDSTTPTQLNFGLRDHHFKQDFFAGLLFGIIIGGLLTLIALKLGII